MDHLLKRGKIFSSTPLRHLQYSDSKLKYFSRKLSNDIATQENEKSNSTSYISEIKILQSKTKNDSFLKICVKSVNNKENKNISAVYRGIFYSWRPKNVYSREQLNLPFLFCTGSQKFINLINGFLEIYFNCKILPIMFSQQKFKWLTVLLLEHVNESFRENTQLVYQIQSNEAKMDCVVSLKSLKEMWINIHEESTNQVSYEEVVRFHTAIEEHLINTCGFDLSHFHLKNVNIPQHITVDVSGKIHIFTSEILDLVFRFLKEFHENN